MFKRSGRSWADRYGEIIKRAGDPPWNLRSWDESEVSMLNVIAVIIIIAAIMIMYDPPNGGSRLGV